jgi:glycosyltransferase involved in cell wall biosynthesis
MNKKQPKVSLGLPVYNGERFIRETLDSILNQTFQDFELIISDNASTDSTESICQEYAANDPRVRYYRNEQNLGAARNYKKVFELSTAEYFKWCASDDVLASTYLEKCVDILDRFPSVILCYPREIFVDESGQPIKEHSNLLNLRSPNPHERFKQYFDLWKKQGFAHGNPVNGLIRSAKLRLTPLLEGYVMAEFGLLVELLFLGEFYEVPEPLFLFRYHAQCSRAILERSAWEGLAVWFDPANQNKIVMPELNLFIHHLKAINKAQIGLWEKAFCYTQMGKFLGWKWKRLIREILIASFQSMGFAYQTSFKSN